MATTLKEIQEKMQENPAPNGVLTKKEQICPVCQTKNESLATHCKTCVWYFQLDNRTPQYALELNRAKQQFQMVNTFNQVLHGMQAQTKVLEKISARLDGLEKEVTQLKENKPTKTVFTQKYEYPVLPPIQKVADFDTVEKRVTWWNTLEVQWKNAFNQAVLRKENEYAPTDEEIKYVLEAPILRLVGPKAMHPSIDFELTNLSGLQHLTDLTLLVLSQNALTNLEGIEHLENLKTLFINDNKLTDLKAVGYLLQLKKLYCHANQLQDIHPLESLINLELLNCSANHLLSFEGITAKHADKLRDFTGLPNDKVAKTAIEQIEAMGITCKKS